MATKRIIMRIVVHRFSVASNNLFHEVVSRLEAAIGRPDMSVFRRDVASAKTYPELEKVVHGAIGPSGLMEFSRIDMAEVMRGDLAPGAPRSLRLTAGNPLIIKRMVEHGLTEYICLTTPWPVSWLLMEVQKR
jgi:hypothetical protein